MKYLTFYEPNGRTTKVVRTPKKMNRKYFGGFKKDGEFGEFYEGYKQEVWSEIRERVKESKFGCFMRVTSTCSTFRTPLNCLFISV